MTSEILRQGIFSDKGIRKALDSCLALNKQTSSVISGLEKENLLYQLKQELGMRVLVDRYFQRFSANPKNHYTEFCYRFSLKFKPQKIPHYSD